MKGVVVSVVLVLAMIELMVQQGQGLSCGEVHSLMAPCIPYLTASGREPGPTCCDGVRNINGMAQSSTAEKREVCTCVKEAANRYTNLKDDAAQALPTKCGVHLDIPVSRNINCNLIN